MRLVGAVLALFALVAVSAFAVSASPLDKATKAYLEGGWAITTGKPDRRGCDGPTDLSDDRELLWETYFIDFRKSEVVEGNFITSYGRMDIIGAEKLGKIIRLRLPRNRNLAVEPLGPDTMLVHEAIVSGDGRNKRFAHRCSRGRS